MRVLGVIPARGGSVRVPRKNLQVIGERSLVWRALDSCCRLNLTWPGLSFPHLSTDDPDIAHEASRWEREHGKPIVILKREARGDKPMIAVLREALARASGEYDVVMCLQPTSPFRLQEDIDRALWWFMFEEPESLVSVNAETAQRNGAIYITRAAMVRDGAVFDEHSFRFDMPAERSIDINTPEDLEEARRIAKEKGW